MYTARHISRVSDLTDPDGLKLYAISVSGAPVNAHIFTPQLQAMKRAASVDWLATPGFAILHQGATLPYLVLCWWGNDNELFVRVAVHEEERWVIDTNRFSFCLWDMEIMWLERKSYIRCMYSGAHDLAAYRADIVIQGAG